MAEFSWGSGRKRSRVIAQEVYNRDGHWTRVFPSRTEGWAVIEHWAAENRYYLVALKGQRRLYQKEAGTGTFYYLTYVDIKHHDNKITVSAWIHVSFALRLFSLFLLPSYMDLSPDGFIGVRKRRDTAREMNSLLVRLRQLPIVGSENFHILDLDYTTLGLIGTLGIPLLLSTYVLVRKLTLVPGLTSTLIIGIGRNLSFLIALAMALIAVHDIVLVRKFSSWVLKSIFAGTALLIFSIATLFLTLGTTTEMRMARFAHHCLFAKNTKCAQEIQGLSEKERASVEQTLDEMDKEVAVRPNSRLTR